MPVSLHRKPTAIQALTNHASVFLLVAALILVRFGRRPTRADAVQDPHDQSLDRLKNWSALRGDSTAGNRPQFQLCQFTHISIPLRSTIASSAPLPLWDAQAECCRGYARSAALPPQEPAAGGLHKTARNCLQLKIRQFTHEFSPAQTILGYCNDRLKLSTPTWKVKCNINDASIESK